MDVYVARQPIFDNKMSVIGYELLYRSSMNNFYDGFNENQATAELINNAFLTMHFDELTSGTKAFISFPQDMLINEIPMLLPKESIVIEILESAEMSDELISACQKLNENGYKIALNDFVFKEIYEPLIETAHIIKVEFSAINYEDQRQMINKYKNRIKFIAEKVEKREEYQLALEMGYDYFQGYFFSRPSLIKSKEIDTINVNLIRILNLLNENEPDYERISEVIETDIGISYKLLKLANSAIFGTVNEIHSLKQALVQLGIIELRKWIYILIMKDIQTIENKELIKTCLIRAKFMDLLAVEVGKNNKKLEYFLTGMFSSLDVLLNRSMKKVTDELILSEDVKGALIGQDNDIKRMLDMIIGYETQKQNVIKVNNIAADLTFKKFTNKYMEALMWVRRLGYLL
ncbi:MAG: diguanylate phosphodiesterase [Sedimentibacter sp.]|jgi:EAL and modified HD-GYP domain-containing signal transduction protein|nr:diguanylate phosphodiesterase [Sedimentibacter sp.]